MRRKPKPITRRSIARLGLYDPSEERDEAIRRVIRSIPRGKVSTYSQVAAAAGFPLYHRLVARILGREGDSLPWQRVLGAGGFIKLKGEAALEQRTRLEMEGVRFKGARVDIDRHLHTFRTWELVDDLPLPPRLPRRRT